MNNVPINLDINLGDLNFEVSVYENNRYVVSWQPGIQLRVIPSTDALVLSQTNGIEVVGDGSVDITINVPSRVYFHIFDGSRRIAVTSDRCIPLKGVRNFRDLGGYIGDSGRPVRWGSLYRSGELSNLGKTDQQFWLSLNVGLIVDFRSVNERSRKPTSIPSEQKPNISILEIHAGNTTKAIKEMHQGFTPSKSVEDLMIDFNRHFVLEQNATFQKFFDLVTTQGEGVLFHCSAGKDRTGFSAALLLSALGVSYEQIMQDYLLTSRYFIAEEFYNADFSKRFTSNVPLEKIKPLLEVKAAYLNAAFDTIKSEYGSVEKYLTQALGVTSAMRKTLQSHYLQG